MAEYNKKYYEEKREQHLAYMSEKVRCTECNCMSARSKLAQHRRTMKHLLNAEIFLLKIKLEDKE